MNNHGLMQFWQASDGIGRAVAMLLLAMSVAAWVLILWKGWQLRRAAADIERAVPAFWAAANLDDGRARLGAMDRERVLLPLLDAALAQPGAGTLEGAGQAASQLTRRLRDALHRGLSHLQWGQVLLASVGSTAAVCGPVWHCLGHLRRAGGHGGSRRHQHRQGLGPDRRSTGDDRRRHCCGRARRCWPTTCLASGWRPVRPSWKVLRTTCAKWCWTLRVAGLPRRWRPETPWHLAAWNATPVHAR